MKIKKPLTDKQHERFAAKSIPIGYLFDKHEVLQQGPVYKKGEKYYCSFWTGFAELANGIKIQCWDGLVITS